MKANVANLQERQKEVEKELDALDDKYVPYRMFESTTKHIEESLGRIETHVRKLTERLIASPRLPRESSDS